MLKYRVLTFPLLDRELCKFWVSIMGYWVFSCIVYFKAHGPICWYHQLDYDDREDFDYIYSWNLKLNNFTKTGNNESNYIYFLMCYTHHMKETSCLLNFWELAPKTARSWLIACSECYQESFKSNKGVTKTWPWQQTLCYLVKDWHI